MPRKNEGSYLFRGNAYALAARFTDPKLVIPTQAGVVLAASGGKSSASVKGFKRSMKEGPISFSEAVASVEGEERADGSHHAVAAVTIRNLNFLNVVKADLILLKILSSHPAPVRRAPNKIPEGSVTFDDSRFEGLKIAGQPVNVTLSKIVSNHPTYYDYSHIQPPRGKHYLWMPDDCAGVFVTTLVEELNVQAKGVKTQGHIITVENFGKIHVAEVIIERGDRRLHMLRFELGSPQVGDAVAGGGEGNGGDIPP